MQTTFTQDRTLFTSRCLQIRDAQWVCHSIASELPHVSTTRMSVAINKLSDKNQKLFAECRWAHSLREALMLAKTPDEKKSILLKDFYKRIVTRINMAKDNKQLGYGNDHYSLAHGFVSQLKYDRLGNCKENARIAELVMKINGIKNACTASLECGNYPVDHVVCIFNKDGSEFCGNVTKSTIIIDPWAGKSDFANNMFITYKNMYKNSFYIPDEGKFKFRNIEHFNFSDNELELLKKDYPQFIYNGKRKFMA